MACYLVLGTPRSGTSAVAGTLHHLGVWMGDDFYEANDWNERGFFADKTLDLMHWSMIRKDNPDGWHTTPVEEISEEYRAEIERRIAKNVPWGFKLSETHTFLHHLQQMISDLKVIRTQRRFEASVDSWIARNHGPLDTYEDGVKRIKEYVVGIDAALARCNIEPMIVRYDDLIQDPREMVRIADFVGLPVTEKARKFIDAGLRRFS